MSRRLLTASYSPYAASRLQLQARDGSVNWVSGVTATVTPFARGPRVDLIFPINSALRCFAPICKKETSWARRGAPRRVVPSSLPRTAPHIPASIPYNAASRYPWRGWLRSTRPKVARTVVEGLTLQKSFCARKPAGNKRNPNRGDGWQGCLRKIFVK